MGTYDVLLGIDRAAKDTGRRLRMQVRERTALAAALKAERLADRRLPNRATMYTHAMQVRQVTLPMPAAPMALPRAA